MRDDEDVFASLQFHDDRLQADDDVAVGFAAEVTVIVLVFVSGGEIGGVLLLDLCICETVADTAVEFVQSLPFQLFEGQEAGSLICALEG